MRFRICLFLPIGGEDYSATPRLPRWEGRQPARQAHQGRRSRGRARPPTRRKPKYLSPAFPLPESRVSRRWRRGLSAPVPPPSTCALHSERDAADSDLEQVQKLRPGPAGAAPIPEEADLHKIQRVNIRIAKPDGLGQNGLALEQLRLAANFEHPAPAAFVFLANPAEDFLADSRRADQRGVSAGDVEVGLGERNFRVVNEDREKRPVPVHLSEQLQATRGIVGSELFQSRPKPVPGRDEVSRL